MNKRVFGIGMTLAMLVLAVMTVPAIAGPNTVYFVPQNISADPGETVYVEVWVNVTDPYGISSDYALATVYPNVTFNPSIGDIIACNRIPGDPWDKSWSGYQFTDDSWWINAYMDPWADPTAPYGLDPGVYPIASLTIEGVSPGAMDLQFSHDLPRASGMVDAIGDEYPNQTWIDGTFTCTGEVPPETFSKPLVAGWNLISLPLTNETDMTVANIIDTSLSGSYDALDRYDASTHNFVALSSSDTMENGVGYFINMTADDTWTYSGSAYTSMNVGLSQGLNMAGWLNCSKDITDALSSIEGNYYYAARWNATSQSFETYNPVAPSVFNDFTMMDRGEGYFISMKTGDTLAESCGA